MSIFLQAEKKINLINKRNTLYLKALKMFPNSPAQLKIRKEIQKLNKLI